MGSGSLHSKIECLVDIFRDGCNALFVECLISNQGICGGRWYIEQTRRRSCNLGPPNRARIWPIQLAQRTTFAFHISIITFFASTSPDIHISFPERTETSCCGTLPEILLTWRNKESIVFI